MKIQQVIEIILLSVIGSSIVIIISMLLTLVLSIGSALGIHPEAIFKAEWIAPVFGLILAGALLRKYSVWASIGTGVFTGLLWFVGWLYLMGRFDFHLWITEAFPNITWQHFAAWISAPVLAFAGCLLSSKMKKYRFSWIIFSISGPVAVILTALIYSHFTDNPGRYEISKGVNLQISDPDKEGTILRLFSFDFNKNPNLTLNTYDCDSDDSHPYDDINSTYLGTPALSVFKKLKGSPVCIVNAAFFTWTEPDRIGSHVAPIVSDNKAHYNVFAEPEMWTFGFSTNPNCSRFTLTNKDTFGSLTKYRTAIGHVRPLIVNGKPLELRPGPGVTKLRCSRVSLGWADNSRLYLLVVREPDGEMSSIGQWKKVDGQKGGMDLLQLQQYWMKMKVKQALILDAGDSTDLVYKTDSGAKVVTSARLSQTLGFLNDKPIRIWLPILPETNNEIGVMNYIYIK